MADTTPSMADHITASLQALADELAALTPEEAAKVSVPAGLLLAPSEPSWALIPAEQLAADVARSQIARGENPGINTTAMLLLTVERLAAVLSAPLGVVATALSSLADDLADVGFTEAAELAREASRAPGARL